MFSSSEWVSIGFILLWKYNKNGDEIEFMELDEKKEIAEMIDLAIVQKQKTVFTYFIPTKKIK